MGDHDPKTTEANGPYAPRSREPDRRLRACADLVKYCSEPYIEDARAFVSTLLDGLRRTRVSVDGGADVLERAASDVAGALRALPPRQRLIIEKCDIAGNTAGSVARSLHVSRRHLFRERNEALEHLSRLLMPRVKARQAQPIVAVDRPNRLDAAFAVSDSLIRLGHWPEARALLLDMMQKATDSEPRWGAAMRLARVSRAKGDLVGAALHLKHATALSQRSGAPWHASAMAVANAYVELDSGRTEIADRSAANAEQRLWAYCVAQSSPPAAAVEALVEAMSLRTAVAAGQGRLADATAQANKAVDACRMFGLLGSAARRATVLRAMCDVFTERDVVAAEATLVRLFEDSLGTGFPEDALVIAAHLARHLRLHGRATEAISFLDLVAPFSKSIGSQEACFDIFTEQLHSHLVLDRPDEAARHFQGLRDLDPQRPMLVADMHLARANLNLKRGSPRESWEAAVEAEHLYRQLNVDRLVGIALRSQAQALIADGRARRGLRAVDDALGVMQDTASPLEVEKMRAMRSSILKKR